MRNLVLYIGGSYPQQAAVRELVSAGFEVHIADRNPNPACSAETPHVHRLDAADAAGAAALAKELQQRGRLVGAYGIADYAFRSVAAVNRLIGGRTSPPDALLTMINKGATKEALKIGGVPMPYTVWSGLASSFDRSACDRVLSEIDEVVVKPADVHASQGITRVSLGDGAALSAAVALAGSGGSSVLVEEYVTGDICNFDALAINGRAMPVSMTYRVAHEQLPFLPTLQVQPAWTEVAEADALIAIGQKTCNALGYRDGPFTIDYVRTSKGPKVLEVSPHFHSIALEIFRGNGNPLRAWLRYLASDSAWQDDLRRREEKAGALAMLRASTQGRMVRVDAEAELADAPHCCDYVRRKADGVMIGSLAAEAGLVALGWFVGRSAGDLEVEIRNRLQNAKPVIDPPMKNELLRAADRSARATL